MEKIDTKQTTFDCRVRTNLVQERQSSVSAINAKVNMLDYCEPIQDITKLVFREFHMSIFYIKRDVKWFKVVARGPNLSVRKDQSGFYQVDSTKIWRDQRDVLALPEHCEQVIFKEDSRDSKPGYIN